MADMTSYIGDCAMEAALKGTVLGVVRVRGVCLTVRDKPHFAQPREKWGTLRFVQRKGIYWLSRSQLAEHFTVCNSISAYL